MRAISSPLPPIFTLSSGLAALARACAAIASGSAKDRVKAVSRG
jgi:hypothetical protein